MDEIWNDLQKEYLNYWVKCILFLESFNSFNKKVFDLRKSLYEWFTKDEVVFVSDRSQDFKAFLEERVGKIEFTKRISMKEDDTTLLFIEGFLVKHEDYNIWR